MRRFVLVLAVAVTAVAYAATASGVYDPNAYCCVDAITSVTYVPGTSISATWRNPDSLVTAAELHAGTTKDSRGVVTLGTGSWDGNITGQNAVNAPSTSVTFQSGAGSTIGSLSFSKDFYVQIWFLCSNYPSSTVSRASPHCNTPNSTPGRTAEFYSAPYLVKVAGSTGAAPAAGGGSATNTVYSLGGTGVYVDTNGQVHTIQGRVGLVAGEALEGGGKVARLVLEEGRVVLSEHAILRLEDGRWVLRQGTAYFNGKFYNVVTETNAVRSSGPATFVLEAHPLGLPEHVQVVSGKVAVKSLYSKLKPVVLTAGFETFIPWRASPKPPKKFTPPTRAFWK